MATIYRKTAKGQTEIETRALKLTPRVRSLLILVDGRRTDDELLRLIQQTGGQAIDELAQGGFIEAIGLTVDPAPAPGPKAPAPARPAAAQPGFEQRRREAVRTLCDQVGPQLSEALALKMERARTAAELQPLLQIAVQLVGNTRGRAAAADYAQRFADG